MRVPRTVAAGGIVWVALVASGVRAQVDHPDRRVWDGVYTASQAARGQERYMASCSRCHNNTLTGSERGPALKGDGFVAKWDNDTLGSLFTVIRDTMPADGGAGLLADDVKVDILAFLLQSNGFPAGGEELKPDAAALEAVKIGRKTVNDGVFTAAQAERGKAGFAASRCAGCHLVDLSGDRGPALKGNDFVAHWENAAITGLFAKIRDTMPPNGISDVSNDTKVDIVAYLLQSNGFPAGPTELKADTLDRIEIVRKGASPGAPNFSLVQVVGCLAPGPREQWRLTRTSDPVVTRLDEPTPAQLNQARARSLGSQSFELVSVTRFKPETHTGQKVEARGLIYRDAKVARLNLTSLKPLDQACPQADAPAR